MRRRPHDGGIDGRGRSHIDGHDPCDGRRDSSVGGVVTAGGRDDRCVGEPRPRYVDSDGGVSAKSCAGSIADNLSDRC